MSIKFKKLNKTIIKCKKCPRLTKFISKMKGSQTLGLYLDYLFLAVIGA